MKMHKILAVLRLLSRHEEERILPPFAIKTFKNIWSSPAYSIRPLTQNKNTPHLRSHQLSGLRVGTGRSFSALSYPNWANLLNQLGQTTRVGTG